MLIRPHLAGAAVTALHFVEHEQQAVVIARLAQALDEFDRACRNAALALDRLDHEAGGGVVDQRQRRFEIVERRIAEAGQQRLEPVTHLRLIGRRDRAHRAAVKGVVEGDQRRALRISVRVVIPPRGLDRALDRFGARIGEEHRVGKAVVDDPLRELLALRRAVQVRHVHQRRGLLGDRLDQFGMAVAERVDRDAGREIEILFALLAIEVAALTSHRAHAATRVHGHQGWGGHGASPQKQKGDHSVARKLF